MKSSYAITSARMKPFSKSVWITPAACGAVAPPAHRPGAHFLHAGGEVGLQAQQLVAGADHAVQARLGQAEIVEEIGRVGFVELRHLCLDRRAHRHHHRRLRPWRACARHPDADCSRSRLPSRWRRTCTGFSVSRCSSCTAPSLPRPAPTRAHRLAVVQRGLQLRQHRLARVASLSPPLAERLATVQRLFHAVQVGERQFGVDDVDVGQRVDLARRRARCRRPRSSARRARSRRSRGCARGTCCPGLHPGRAGDQAGDVDELDRGRHDLLRLDDRRPARRGADPAPARCRRSDRSCRTGSSPPRCPRLVSALNSVDLPTLGRPTMPHLMPILQSAWRMRERCIGAARTRIAVSVHARSAQLVCSPSSLDEIALRPPAAARRWLVDGTPISMSSSLPACVSTKPRTRSLWPGWPMPMRRRQNCRRPAAR